MHQWWCCHSSRARRQLQQKLLLPAGWLALKKTCRRCSTGCSQCSLPPIRRGTQYELLQLYSYTVEIVFACGCAEPWLYKALYVLLTSSNFYTHRAELWTLHISTQTCNLLTQTPETTVSTLVCICFDTNFTKWSNSLSWDFVVIFLMFVLGTWLSYLSWHRQVWSVCCSQRWLQLISKWNL